MKNRTRIATLGAAALMFSACKNNTTEPPPPANIPPDDREHIIPLVVGAHWAYIQDGKPASSSDIPELFPIQFDTAFYQTTIDRTGNNLGQWGWFIAGKEPHVPAGRACWAFHDEKIWAGTFQENPARVRLDSWIIDHPKKGDSITDAFIGPGMYYIGDTIITVPAGQFTTQHYRSERSAPNNVHLFLSQRIGLVKMAVTDSTGKETSSLELSLFTLN